ncbi:MAG: type II toxin-antitoxin system RelE/ParE family toxin [Nanoarchaeota archaeon]|nr:type II toxin-antitoxin system RelE/ParE family toxin [Nanoarchaeota archaeon]
MVNVRFDEGFKRIISKIKDAEVQKNIKNHIRKIVQNPEIGKPMRNVRKGTREVYVGHFRISYAFHQGENLLEFLDFYHKDEQ